MGNKIKNVNSTIFKSFRFIGPSAYFCVIFLFLNSLIAILLSILSPIYLRDITDALDKYQNGTATPTTAEKMYHTVLQTSIMIIVFYTAKFILSDLPYNLIKTYFDQNSGHKFRKALFRKIGKLPLSYFDNSSIGHNMTVMVHDTGSVSGNFIGSICQVFTGFAYFIGLMIAMFITNWAMALMCIIAIPVFGTFLPMIIKKSKILYGQRWKTLSKVNGNIEEMFTNTLIIRAANKEEEASKHFDTLINDLYKISKKSSFIGSLSGPMFSITNSVILILVVLFATLLQTTTGNNSGVVALPSFILFIGMFNSPFSAISGNIQNLLGVSVCLERIFNLLEQEEIVPEPPFSHTPENKDITFENVSFGYNENKTIINDFNLTVPFGKTIAIVGTTGSGKSTLVNLLMRFYEVTSGKIKIGNVNITDINRENLRDMFSMVLQEPWVFQGTIKENIIYNSKNVSQEKLEEVCEKINLLHFIKTLPKGFETILDDSANISAGEKQLITIARLLIKDAPFVILDEATSNVDTQTEHEVQQAMGELTKQKTSFIIAHRLSTIKNADTILVLQHGQIIEKGNHDELIKLDGEYAKLYNSQFADCA